VIAKKIYETLKDFGFSQEEIIRFIKSQYGEPITIELEHERQSWEDHSDDIFRMFGKEVDIEASRSQTENFDLGQSKFLSFTVTGTIEDVLDALNNAGWLWSTDDPAQFIKDHIVI